MTRSRRALLFALAFAGVACASAASGTKPTDGARDEARASSDDARSRKARARLAKKARPDTAQDASGDDGALGGGAEPAPLAIGDAADGPAEEGLASFYADLLAGNRTASGERYRPAARTCAHRTHKFGTVLRVVAVDSGKSTTCRVNDRGPFVSGRVVDVSKRSAEELGMLKAGVIKVRVFVSAGEDADASASEDTDGAEG